MIEISNISEAINLEYRVKEKIRILLIKHDIKRAIKNNI